MHLIKKLSSGAGFEEQQKLQKQKKTMNFFSQILDDTLQTEKNMNPQFLRIKNNILLIILLFSAYGIYFLIGDFIDILLTAYIAGIAYQQMRQRFSFILMDPRSYRGYTEHFIIRLIKAIFLGAFGFVLPYLRYALGHPEEIKALPTIQELEFSFRKTRNMVVIGLQVCILILIFYMLLGPYLQKIGQKLRPTNKTFVKVIFATLVLTISLLMIIIVPAIMFKEVSSLGYALQMKVESKLGCQIFAFQDHDNKDLPYCSEKAVENQLVRQTISEFKNQNETIQTCLKFIERMEDDYVGSYIDPKTVQDYDEIICTWYSFIEKAGTVSGISETQSVSSVMSSGANVFKTLFGSLAVVLSGFSNFIFSFTTFITMFYLTTQYFHSSSGVLKDLFSEHKQQLISSITNLIQATLFIAIEHFMMSIVLLQIFSFTNLNLMLATLLSSMAFFPFFRPWFGILIVAFIRIIILNEYKVSLLFVPIYYFFSEQIYSIHLRKLQIHEIITNMSVLFGIYRFGIAGIFYGPLIIILYKCVEKELLKNDVYTHKSGE